MSDVEMLIEALQVKRLGNIGVVQYTHLVQYRSLSPTCLSVGVWSLLVKLSKSYQFKIIIRETIPENIKLFALNVWPQSWTQTFLGRSTNDHSFWYNDQDEMQLKR